MKKKLFSLLVLLMTAVTGAVAQSYEAKVFDVPASWTDDNTTLSAADLPEDFVQITVDEAKALAVPDGYVVLIYGFNGDNVKFMVFDSGTLSSEEEDQPARRNFINLQTEDNAIICYTAAAVPVTEITKNQWQFLMPDYAVVANVEYETELALNEVDDNAAKLDEWNGYEADVTLTRTLAAGVWNTLAAPFGISATNYATLQQLLSVQGGTIAVKELTSTTLSGQTLTLNFTDATQIEAGKPYLVKVSKELNLATLPAQIDVLGSPINPFKGVIISKTAVPVETSYVNFIPTLGKTLVTGPDGDKDNKDAVLFLAAGNTLKNPTVVNDPEQQSSYLKGFRAYFQLKDASNARSITLNLGDEATSIISTTDNTDNTDSVYDLQGRKVDNAATKGVYIQNGRKVVVK